MPIPSGNGPVRSVNPFSLKKNSEPVQWTRLANPFSVPVLWTRPFHPVLGPVRAYVPVRAPVPVSPFHHVPFLAHTHTCRPWKKRPRVFHRAKEERERERARQFSERFFCVNNATSSAREWMGEEKEQGVYCVFMPFPPSSPMNYAPWRVLFSLLACYRIKVWCTEMVITRVPTFSGKMCVNEICCSKIGWGGVKVSEPSHIKCGVSKSV